MDKLEYQGFKMPGAQSTMSSSMLMMLLALYPAVAYFFHEQKGEEHMLYRYMYPEGRSSVVYICVCVASELCKDVCARKYLYQMTGNLYSRYIGRVWSAETKNIFFVVAIHNLCIVFYVQLGWILYTRKISPFDGPL